MINHFKFSKPTISEDALVAGLQQRDTSSFTYLYDHYSPGMYSCILKIVNNNELAEDLLHDAFLRIWKNIASYNPDKGRLYTWVFNICRNISIDSIRSSNRKRVRDNKLEAIQQNETDNQAALINRIDAAFINKKVSGLKTNQRILIDMAYNHGFSHYEIASKLEIPLGTVKSRIYQGLRNIKLAMSA